MSQFLSFPRLGHAVASHLKVNQTPNRLLCSVHPLTYFFAFGDGGGGGVGGVVYYIARLISNRLVVILSPHFPEW